MDALEPLQPSEGRWERSQRVSGRVELLKRFAAAKLRREGCELILWGIRRMITMYTQNEGQEWEKVRNKHWESNCRSPHHLFTCERVRNWSAWHFPMHGLSAAMRLPFSDSFSSLCKDPISSGRSSSWLLSMMRILSVSASDATRGPGSVTMRLLERTRRLRFDKAESIMGRLTILLFVISNTCSRCCNK